MSVFKLPDLGEGLPEAEIVEWFVKEGDHIKQDVPMVAMETAKAIVDIPAPQTGVVAKLYGSAGDIIQTGDPLLEFDTNDTDDVAETVTENAQDSGTVVGEIKSGQQRYSEHAQQLSSGRGRSAKATPAVRALAKRLEIDLSMVSPSGPNGTVLASDVERVSRIFQEVGKLEPLKGVRRAMANTMSRAHEEVVSVTLNEDADIHAWDDQQDTTARLVRATVYACSKEPSLNAWYDNHAMGRRLIDAVHIGIAVDTDQGLFVPVVRNAEKHDAQTLRQELDRIKDKLKSRSLSPDEMRGNTITLSNFGSIGGRYADPIIVPPTVAIIGAGKRRNEPVAVNDVLEVHLRIPLSLSFDHRCVTGGEACRFMVALIEDLQRPD